MVKIRLTRTGRKHSPSYRIVIIPQREKRDSKVIEEIGFYSPTDKVVKLEKERAEYWISVGAQPSDTVRRILENQKIIKPLAFKRTYKKTPGKKAQERAAAKAE